MELNQFVPNKTIKNEDDLERILKELEEKTTIYSTLKNNLDLIQKTTRKDIKADLSFLIQETFMNPKIFESYFLIIQYLTMRVQERFIDIKSFQNEFESLIGFLNPQEKDYENKKKFIIYSSKNTKNTKPSCGKILNLQNSGIDELIKNYDFFLEFDKELQKKFKFDSNTKKFKYDPIKLRYLKLTLLDITINYDGNLDVFLKIKKYKKKKYKKISSDMKDLIKIQKKYKAKIHFLIQTYYELYPNCGKLQDK